MKTYKINATQVAELDFAAEMTLKVSESCTIVPIAMTDDATINIDEDSTPVPGDKIIIKASSDGTARDLTFGTGITGPVLAGVINKTKVQEFVYDGAAFVAAAAAVQID